MASIDNAKSASAIANIVARGTQRILKQNTVVPLLVGRDYDGEDIQQHGDRVTISALGSLTVNPKAQGSAVTIQTPSLTSTAITLKQLEVTFALDHLTRIQTRPDLMAGYSEKAGIALAEYINADIPAAVYPLAGHTASGVASFTDSVFGDAEMYLNDAKMPMSGRYAIVGHEAKRGMHDWDRLHKYDYQGPGAWEAVQRGSVGMLNGFDTYMTQGITRTAGEVKNIAFQKGAIQMITRPLDTSMNGVSGSVTSYYDSETGIDMRTSVWYDHNEQRWLMTIDCLYGFQVLEPNGVVVIPTATILP